MNIYNGTLSKELDLSSVPKGQIKRCWVELATDGLGLPIAVPVMIARGVQDGPVVGLTAVVHGNELNGIQVIQRLFNEIDVNSLAGTIVGVLVVNAPGLLLGQRKFNDGADLNHIMPGKAMGNQSEIYDYRLIDRIVNRFDFLIDLHTASFGRINSYYIRADMEDSTTKEMALLQNADIIVHNPPHDGTLRGAANDLKIPAITLEVGDPNRFQRGMIRSGLTGIHNFLINQGMQPGEIEMPDIPAVLCRKSIWAFTQGGGILRVTPELTQMIVKDEVIGELRNVFGDLVKEYFSPESGIVIGKSINPIAQSGARILHVGILTKNGSMIGN